MNLNRVIEKRKNFHQVFNTCNVLKHTYARGKNDGMQEYERIEKERTLRRVGLSFSLSAFLLLLLIIIIML